MEIKHLNTKLYTELPIDELDGRLSMEELQDKLELGCWPLQEPVRPPGECPEYGTCPAACPPFAGDPGGGDLGGGF